MQAETPKRRIVGMVEGLAVDVLIWDATDAEAEKFTESPIYTRAHNAPDYRSLLRNSLLEPVGTTGSFSKDKSLDHSPSVPCRDHSENHCMVSEDHRPVAAVVEEKESEEKKKHAAQVAEVFDHWMKVWDKPAQTRATPKRKARIAAALKRKWTVEELKQAVSGYLHSPHHCGDNDSQTRYDDIELFLRSDEKIEKGLQLYEQHHTAASTPISQPVDYDAARSAMESKLSGLSELIASQPERLAPMALHHRIVTPMGRLLDQYSAQVVNAAIAEALAANSPYPKMVAKICERLAAKNPAAATQNPVVLADRRAALVAQLTNGSKG